MNLTTLDDECRNIKITTDNGKIDLEDLVISIQQRIISHRKMIERNRETITSNVDFSNIIKEDIERICEREVKIFELKEFMKVCLGIDI